MGRKGGSKMTILVLIVVLVVMAIAVMEPYIHRWKQVRAARREIREIAERWMERQHQVFDAAYQEAKAKGMTGLEALTVALDKLTQEQIAEAREVQFLPERPAQREEMMK